MDSADNSIYKMDQRRKINISKIDKILKVFSSNIFKLHSLEIAYFKFVDVERAMVTSLYFLKKCNV